MNTESTIRSPNSKHPFSPPLYRIYTPLYTILCSGYFLLGCACARERCGMGSGPTGCVMSGKDQGEGSLFQSCFSEILRLFGGSYGIVPGEP